MAFFLSQLPGIWPWLILITAQVTALFRHRRLAFALLGIFVLIALANGLITATAFTVIALGLAGAAYLPRVKGKNALMGHLALIVWSLILGAHVLPGVNNLLVLDQVQAGPESRSFTLYLNLDKPMVFFAVLLAWPAVLHNGASIRIWRLMIGLCLLPILFFLGLSLGAVQPEFGLPAWWLMFALSNLFLTCLPEEAFFRGYLQSAITAQIGPVAGIACASALFGLAHISGGVSLAVFASLLGLACGLGYFATGRLWVPVAMHFAFNILHLALFTYPGPA